MTSKRDALDPLHGQRIDHAHCPASTLAIAHIDELRRGVVADVIGVRPGSKIDCLEQRKSSGVVDTGLVGLAVDDDPMGGTLPETGCWAKPSPINSTAKPAKTIMPSLDVGPLPERLCCGPRISHQLDGPLICRNGGFSASLSLWKSRGTFQQTQTR
jgi:hypothetical protein